MATIEELEQRIAQLEGRLPANQTPVRFPGGIAKTELLTLVDEILVGINADGSTKAANISLLINLISSAVSGGIEATVEPDTVLPAPAQSGRVMFMKSGDYTQPNTDPPVILTAPADAFNLGYWDGESWSIPISIEIDADLSNYTPITDFNATKDRVNEISELSPNLINNALILSGNYAPSNGNPQVNNNWIRTPKLPIQASTQYTLSGHGSASDVQARIVFFDANDAFISTILSAGSGIVTPVTFTTPANAATLGINIVNSVDIGLDPTNNQYADSVMLQLGETATAYEPYGAQVPADRIQGLEGLFVTPAQLTGEVATINGKIDPIQSNVDYLLRNIVRYAIFNGTAEIPLSNSFTLSADGDYIEFEAKTGPGWANYEDSLGMFGTIDGANNFGIYDANRYFLRTISGSPYIEFTDLPNLIGEWRRIKLQVAGGGTQWDFYVDGVLNQSQPKDSDFVVGNIGNGYSGDKRSIFDLKYVKVHTEGADLDIEDPTAFPGAINVTRGYIDPNKVEEFSPVYVSFDPVGFNGRESIIVYVRRGNTDRYVGHKVQHDYDMDEVIYADLYRIRGADEYRYADGQMTLLNANTLVSGESECVYQDMRGGKVDFTGGYHGDETLLSIELFIDGVKKELTEAFELIPCKFAHYVQKSQMHETADNVGGVETPVVGHPVDAIHYKKTIFGNSGYSTYNDLVWVRSFPLFWYHGICCLGKIQATTVYDEEFQTEEMTGTTNHYFNKIGNKVMEFSNELNGLAATITSTLRSASVADADCENFIWDRASDSKYYRKAGNYNSVVGQKDRSEMHVTYHAL